MPDSLSDVYVEPARILVVDDALDNRDLLVALLEDDYAVATAADGVEGLAAIADFMPDLVLLDLMMPNLDGFGVLLALREAAGHAPPVLVISASSERAHRLRALELGAHDFVGKPVDGEELRVRVRNTLKVRRAAALAEANDALRRADRYRDEFLSVMSHELRSPLNFIVGHGSTF